MDDLISREELLKTIFPYGTEAVNPKDYAINAEAVRRAIVNAPSVGIVVAIEIDKQKVGKAAVDFINGVTKKTGRSPLID